MPIIDRTYFRGDIQITGKDNERLGKDDEVNYYIDIYEPEFLRAVLGVAFSKLLTDGLIPETVDARWDDLLNGKEYTSGGNTYYWDGLAPKADSKGLKSPIANYVYWHWLRKEAQRAGSIGVVQPTAENATRVAPIDKQVMAWNEMVDMIEHLHDYLEHATDEDGESIYPEFELSKANCPDYQNTFGI